MATTRVYILAKELGVKSTAIVQKCQDEGLDVKNHMSVISAGLAATIREWFSDEEGTTSVETAEKVDLKKVRVKKKVKRKAKAKKAKTAKRAKPTKETAEQATEPVAVETAEGVEGGKQESTSVIVEEPKEPEPIVPAGPILEKPEPAQLSGPRVVRVEAPEPLQRPRPRPRPRYDEPVTEPLIYTEEDKGKSGVAVEKGGKRSRRYKERTHGRRKDERDIEVPQRPKAVSKWRQRDIEDKPVLVPPVERRCD
jgi:translation initiation factor IF-2